MDFQQALNTRANFVDSTNKRPILVIENYEYTRQYARVDGTTVWICRKCKVKAETLDGVITKVEAHSHIADVTATATRVVKRI